MMTSPQIATSTNHYFSFRVLAVLTLTVSLLLAVLAARPVHAATTFTVNSTGDQADVNRADDVCDADAASGLQCTLRAAIEQANATQGADEIDFGIPGTGVKTITPASALPDITEQVAIDGYTQTGARANTLAKGTNAVLKIELNGSNLGSSSGIAIFKSSNSVVKGLVINRFGGDGVTLDEATNARVEGNFIGTDPSGTTPQGNVVDGVAMFFSSNNTVGGASPAARNLISGNTDGVLIDPASDGNKVLGNLIGTQKDGATALRNLRNGVAIQGDSNTVGGASTAAANTIAFNGEDGVTVVDDSSTGNRILRNSTFSNGEEGIDLGLDGPTTNDAGDADVGANDLQNKPVLTSASTVSGKTTITGKLGTRPGAVYSVRLFSSPSGNEGKKFVGQRNVTVDTSANVAFTFSPATAVAVGQKITATATNEISGDTSEFATPRKVTS